jgi:UPF0755 protein
MFGAYRGWLDYKEFLESPLDLPASGLVFDVARGDSGRAIVSRLAAQGVTRDDWRWRLLMKMEPVTIKAGEYALASGLKPAGLMRLFASGEVVQHRFTIVEGWTFRQLLSALSSRTDLTGSKSGYSGAENLEAWVKTVLAESDIEHPEGWFLPETYLFTKNEDIRDILLRSHKAMLATLNEAWLMRNEDSPLKSPYELLILASIIEKETGLVDERGRVAGVFTRRLHKGMRLQTDPTVIYGLGDSFDGDLRRRDLQADTPYNTYTRHGLPPTPISLPGRASLMAAAQPQAGEALFFVADGQGGHTFSVTLEEHQKAVRKLISKP